MDKIVTRWIIRADMEDVLDIEDRCFGKEAWAESEFQAVLRQRNCIGKVAQIDGIVVGYMVYELHKTHFNVINLGVSPLFQRKGVAQELLNGLKRGLNPDSRAEILGSVCEKNLAGQLFFQSQGFVCDGIDRDHYDDGQDAYEFSYILRVREAV